MSNNVSITPIANMEKNIQILPFMQTIKGIIIGDVFLVLVQVKY